MKIKGRGTHDCAPPEWRSTPNCTGDYDFDASLARCKNQDVPVRLKLYLLTDEPGYGPRTAYNGYSGYSGDE